MLCAVSPPLFLRHPRICAVSPPYLVLCLEHFDSVLDFEQHWESVKFQLVRWSEAQLASSSVTLLAELVCYSFPQNVHTLPALESWLFIRNFILSFTFLRFWSCYYYKLNFCDKMPYFSYLDSENLKIYATEGHYSPLFHTVWWTRIGFWVSNSSLVA